MSKFHFKMYSVWLGRSKGGATPMVLSKVAEGLSRQEANTMAASMRRKKEDNTNVAVYRGNQLKAMV
jgi:hypothetical protein